MAISQSDLSLKQAENNTDLTTNGGWLTSAAVSTSLFPDVTGAERTSGITRYRKIFLKNEQGNTSAPPDKYVELPLLNALAYFENITPADDRMSLKPGSVADTQAEAATYTGWAGVGYLYTDTLTVATTNCQVEMEANGASGEMFQVGGIACITNGLTKDFVTLTSVTYNGTRYTLQFNNTPITNGYLRAFETQTANIITANTIGYTLAGMDPNEYAGRLVRVKSATVAGAGQIRRIVSNTTDTLILNYDFTTLPQGTVVYEILQTYVSMCAPLGTVVASYSGVVKHFTVGGLFNETAIKLSPVGAKDDQWTLLFQADGTTFTITGLKYGNIGGGSITGPDPTKPSTGTSFYFEIPSTAWTGPFQVGDYVVFVTYSSSKSVWIKEVVPSGANPHRANTWDLGISGDTV